MIAKRPKDDVCPFRLGSLGVHTWAGLAISLICLALAFKDVTFSRVIAVLAETRVPLVVLAFGAVMAATTASVVRWRLLLAPSRPGLGQLFVVFMISHLGNTVLPWKLGTLLRAYLAARGEKISFSFVLGTVVVERVLDTVIIVLLFFGLLPLIALPSWLQRSGLGIGVTLVLFFALMVLTAYQKDWLLTWLRRLSHRFPGGVLAGLGYQVELALGSLDVLRRREAHWPLVAWSLVVWTAGVLANWVALVAMDLYVPLLAALVLLVALQFGNKLPSSPGNIGVFHYVTVLTLSIFGVERALALSYAFVLHAVVFIGPALIGALCLWKWQHDLSWPHLLAAGNLASNQSQDDLP